MQFSTAQNVLEHSIKKKKTPLINVRENKIKGNIPSHLKDIQVRNKREMGEVATPLRREKKREEERGEKGAEKGKRALLVIVILRGWILPRV